MAALARLLTDLQGLCGAYLREGLRRILSHMELTRLRCQPRPPSAPSPVIPGGVGGASALDVFFFFGIPNMSNAFRRLDARARRAAPPESKHNENCRFCSHSEKKEWRGGVGRGGGGGGGRALFGFQATVSAGCSESCRVGS